MSSLSRILSVLVLAVTAALSSWAQSVNDTVPDIVGTLTGDGNIKIDQPQTMMKRLEYHPEASDSESQTQQASRYGYRVEIFSDNNARTAKTGATARRNQVLSRLPQYPAYLSFDAPFWRVRVGDFTTRAAAESAMAELRQTFPGYGSAMRIVRCEIARQ